MNALAWLAPDSPSAGPGFWIALAAVSTLAALAALWLTAWLAHGGRGRGRRLTAEDTPLAFLFDGESLVDATPQGRRLMAAAPEEGTEWQRLMALLLPRFPELETRLDALGPHAPLVLPALDRETRLVARWRAGLLRLAVEEVEPREVPAEIDAQGVRAMEHEIATLRAVTDATPCPVWRQTRRGRITWANRAYLEVAARADPATEAGTWPPPALFTPAELTAAVNAAGARRLTMEPADGSAGIWFDVTSTEVGDEVLFVADDVTAVVRAEERLRDFSETVTRTFSHLSIGLAIFDGSRQLALFNPALTDMTQLPVEFLSGRPPLFGFLDRLRESGMMPEPRDYRSWRSRLVELETAAVEGSFAETWSLPSGETWRVTGRPHPDGAIALLFEDISSEISLTRRFRSELETGQEVLDTLDDAIAVFSPGGVLTLSNSAYAALWGDDPGTTIRDITLTDATDTWRGQCAPTRLWDDLRDFASRGGERAAWSGEVPLRNGRGLVMRAVPLAGGATMVSFRTAQGGRGLRGGTGAAGLPPQLRLGG